MTPDRFAPFPLSYGEGLANHTGPESCGDDRKVVAEALTACAELVELGYVRAGYRATKTLHPERRRLASFGRQYRANRHREIRPGSAGS